MAEGAQKRDPIIEALESDVPQVYFNGFSNSIGNGDIMMTLMRNGKPVLILNASYTVTKTLAQGLGQMMNALENSIDNKIYTVSEIGQALTKLQKKKRKNEKGKTKK